ncbi:glycerol-3-phosphate dehydrogenase, partial [Crenichthys baileyi]
QEFDVRAKCVINATGPFTEVLWKMDDQKNHDICQSLAGVRIVIPGYYSLSTSHRNIILRHLRPRQCGAPGSRQVIFL